MEEAATRPWVGVKTTTVQARTTEAERDRLEEEASKRGMTMSTFLLWCYRVQTGQVEG